MAVLSWRHHTLIQALLSRGPLKEKEFHSIFSGVTDKNPGTHQQVFNDYLLNINKELSFVQLELRACRNQYDGCIYYGVVNNVTDEHSKLGTKYTVPQIAFYKGIIEAIAQDATAKGNISSIDALNIRLENQDGSSHIPPAFRNFSMSQKEKTLEELVQDQWLCSTPDGNIGLGLRSFLDLRSWFRNNDIPACEVCNEAGVKADLCQNEGCTVRIHQYCLKRKFSQRKVERVCPGCSTPWLLPVSKAEVVEDDDANVPSQNQPPPPGPSMRKKLRTCRDVDSVALVSTSSQAPAPTTSATSTTADMRRSTRSSARPR